MKIESLIQELSSKYNLRYHIYNEVGYEVFPFAIRLEIQINGKLFSSWGVDQNKDLAFFKGLMELVERVSFFNSIGLYFKKKWFSFDRKVVEISKEYNISPCLLVPDNSNGVGLGLTSFQAKKNAKLELIERHTILTAILFGIAPKRCLDIPSEITVPENHNLSFYYWKMNDFITVVAVDSLPGKGFIFGHACSKSLKKAMTKAWEELVPNIIQVHKTTDKERIITDIVKNDIQSFSQYWRYSGDRRMYDFLNSISERSYDEIPKLKNFFATEILITEEFKCLGFPLRCFRVISPEAQQLFFDKWSLELINPNLHFNGSMPDFPHLIS